jgi:hypothetical protein
MKNDTKATIVACPTCGVPAGKRCVLAGGGPRNEPHPSRKVFGCRSHGKEKLVRVGVERAQKERIRRDSAGATQAGICEAVSYEVCPEEGDEETD